MDASGLAQTLSVEVGLRLYFGLPAGISWVSAWVPTPSDLLVFIYIQSVQRRDL